MTASAGSFINSARSIRFAWCAVRLAPPGMQISVANYSSRASIDRAAACFYWRTDGIVAGRAVTPSSCSAVYIPCTPLEITNGCHLITLSWQVLGKVTGVGYKRSAFADLGTPSRINKAACAQILCAYTWAHSNYFYSMPEKVEIALFFLEIFFYSIGTLFHNSKSIFKTFSRPVSNLTFLYINDYSF